MNILIFGHTGMLGNALKQHWKNKHHLVGISRKRLQQSNIESHTWDDLDDILTKQKFDVAINLCGETIGQPWHKFSRKKIESSRIETTKKIVNAISTLPIHLINASGIGIYDSVSHLNETRFDEKTPVLKSNGFLQTLAYEWEKEAIKHQTTTLLRTAVVFKKDDGVLKKLLMGKQIKVLTQLGSGNNPFPWISIEDWSRAVDLVVSKKILGPINLTSPEISTYNDIMNIFCTKTSSMKITMPDFVVKTLFGEMGESLFLTGTAALPKKLLDMGFEFNNYNVSSIDI